MFTMNRKFRSQKQSACRWQCHKQAYFAADTDGKGIKDAA